MQNGFTPLHGAREIARAANVSVRRAFYLLERGLLPAQKLGGILRFD